MSISQITEKRALQLLAIAQENFEKRWAPQYQPAAEDFHRELLYLVHCIYREAQAPIVERFAQVIAAMPVAHTLVTAPEKDKDEIDIPY